MIPTVKPNVTFDGDSFYVSYNWKDRAIYGDSTTALVKDDMSKFYVLNGNHRGKYITLLDKGWDACLEYFKANKDQWNKYSDIP